ncbi:MAG: 2Fe-2S iron-sulfur cluster-binding protein, partial [Rhodothermales bacterium]|nr:2Fe-2S iron-sulfur cluster-binding protein [Rhodothermales bacterium]
MDDPGSHASRFEIEFEPVGRRAEATRGSTLLSVAQDAGVQLVAVCAGIGICGSCRVRCVEGALTPAEPEEETEFSREEIEDGWRLAC